MSPKEIANLKRLLFSDDYAVRQQGKGLALASETLSPLLEALSNKQLTCNESILYLYLLHPTTDALNLEELSMNRGEFLDFKFAHFVPNLKKLEICSSPLGDCSDLASLINLKELSLEGCENLTDITPIQSLVALEKLDLANTDVGDVRPLAGLVKLKELNLSGGYMLKSLQGIDGLVGLTHLYLADTPAVAGAASVAQYDVVLLANLQNLEALSLAYCDQLEDISPVSSLATLRELNISGTYVADLGPLSKLSNLGWLDLTSIDGITDLSPLHGLTNLRKVNLWKNGEGGSITDEEVDRLVEALPNINIGNG